MAGPAPCPLSLHPLNAIDATPVALIEIAGALRVDLVCLFTYVPPAAAGRYPVVAPGDIPAVRHALTQAGVRLCNLEVFPLDRDDDTTRFTQALETGAALGASRAAGRGSLLLDTLHLVRGGGTAADVAAADLIGYAQLSDGPADMPADRRWHEAIVDRQSPGDGAFPLADILRPLPPGTICEVEVPQTAARKAGVPPLERARRAVDAMRRTLATVRNGERA